MTILPVDVDGLSRTDHLIHHNQIHQRINDLYDIRDYGAVVDGVTDDTVAFQAALDAAGLTNGIVRLPLGVIRTTAPLIPTGSICIEGTSRNGTVIKNGASTLFEWEGDGCSVKHLTLQSEWPGGGHIFEQVGTVAHNLFFDLMLLQGNDDKSVYIHTVDAGNHLFNFWLDFVVRHTSTATAPTFYFLVLSGNGATNFNTWQQFEITRTGNYGFWFESQRSGNYIYDAVLRDGAWEVPNGGCVKILGGNNCVIENHSVYDLNIAIATKHLFHLGNGTHATSPAPTRHCVLRNLRLIGPDTFLDEGVQFIYLESAKVYNAILEHIRTNVTGNLPIDYGFNNVLEIGCNAVTRTNEAYIVQVDGGGIVLGSPNGTRWRITVADDGTLGTEAG